MTDPVADMLTRMRNALMAGHDRVEFPASKIKAGICKVLKEEGYIRSFKIIVKEAPNVSIKVLFKDNSLVGIKRVSKPGLRQYRGYREYPRVISGLGTSVVSTSQGILSSREAKRRKLGGEVLCNVW
ncbi:MAG: 30S ribosomal protein S8 [Deltaproteobacteria bacterium]|nr:MAG: 30S ribosomal protein S8 [Deltaproteobacteria bacterium]